MTMGLFEIDPQRVGCLFEIDPGQRYRLIDVQTHDGKTKTESGSLYHQRVGCIARNIRGVWFGGDLVVCMNFIQDANGGPLHRMLRTSVVSDVSDRDGCLEIHTLNSVYILVPVTMEESRIEG